MRGPGRIRERIRRLEADPGGYGGRVPHPLAASLILPDGAPPDAVRTWATFDDRWPSPSADRRSEVSIADDRGRVLPQPMADVFRYACLDSVRAELEDDPDTTYLEARTRRIARASSCRGSPESLRRALSTPRAFLRSSGLAV